MTRSVPTARPPHRGNRGVPPKFVARVLVSR